MAGPTLVAWLQASISNDLLLGTGWLQKLIDQRADDVTPDHSWTNLYQDHGSTLEIRSTSPPAASSNRSDARLVQVISLSPLLVSDGANFVRAILAPDCERTLTPRHGPSSFAQSSLHTSLAVRDYSLRCASYGPPSEKLCLVLRAVEWNSHSRRRSANHLVSVLSREDIKAHLAKLAETRRREGQNYAYPDPDSDIDNMERRYDQSEADKERRQKIEWDQQWDPDNSFGASQTPEMGSHPGHESQSFATQAPAAGNAYAPNRPAPRNLLVRNQEQGEQQRLEGLLKRPPHREYGSKPQSTNGLLGLLREHQRAQDNSRDAPSHEAVSAALVTERQRSMTKGKTARTEVPREFVSSSLGPSSMNRQPQDASPHTSPGAMSPHGQEASRKSAPSALSGRAREASPDTSASRSDWTSVPSLVNLIVTTHGHEDCQLEATSITVTEDQRNLQKREDAWHKPDPRHRRVIGNIPIQVQKQICEPLQTDEMDLDHDLGIQAQSGSDQSSDTSSEDEAPKDTLADASSNVSWSPSPTPEPPKSPSRLKDGLPPDSSLQSPKLPPTRRFMQPPSSPPGPLSSGDYDGHMEIDVDVPYDGADHTRTGASPPATNTESFDGTSLKSAIQVKDTPLAKQKATGETDASSLRQRSSGTSIVHGTYEEPVSSNRPPSHENTLSSHLPSNRAPTSSNRPPSGQGSNQTYLASTIRTDMPQGPDVPGAPTGPRAWQAYLPDAALPDHISDAYDAPMDDAPMDEMYEMYEMYDAVPESRTSPRTRLRDSVNPAGISDRAIQSHTQTTPPSIRGQGPQNDTTADFSPSASFVKRKSDTSPPRLNKQHKKRRNIKIVGFGDSPPLENPLQALEQHNKVEQERIQEVLSANVQPIGEPCTIVASNWHHPIRHHPIPEGLDVSRALYFMPSSLHAEPSVQVSSTSCNERSMSVFERFKAAYPGYTGDAKHFATQCKSMLDLDREDKMVPRSMWDDYLIRNRTEYKDYVMRCLEDEEDVFPYNRYYKDNVRATLYEKGILQDREVLGLAFEEYSESNLEYSNQRSGPAPTFVQQPSRRSLPSTTNNTQAKSAQARPSLPAFSESWNHPPRPASPQNRQPMQKRFNLPEELVAQQDMQTGKRPSLTSSVHNTYGNSSQAQPSFPAFSETSNRPLAPSPPHVQQSSRRSLPWNSKTAHSTSGQSRPSLPNLPRVDGNEPTLQTNIYYKSSNQHVHDYSKPPGHSSGMTNHKRTSDERQGNTPKRGTNTSKDPMMNDRARPDETSTPGSSARPREHGRKRTHNQFHDFFLGEKTMTSVTGSTKCDPWDTKWPTTLKVRPHMPSRPTPDVLLWKDEL